MGTKSNAYRGGSATEAKKKYEVKVHNLIMGKILEKIMEMRGIDEETLAKMAKMRGKRMIQEVLKGNRALSKPVAEKVAKALGVPMSVLFSGRILTEDEIRMVCGLFQAIEKGKNDSHYQKVRDSILREE